MQVRRTIRPNPTELGDAKEDNHVRIHQSCPHISLRQPRSAAILSQTSIPSTPTVSMRPGVGAGAPSQTSRKPELTQTRCRRDFGPLLVSGRVSLGSLPPGVMMS